jgi:hypothetical protein
MKGFVQIISDFPNAYWFQFTLAFLGLYVVHIRGDEGRLISGSFFHICGQNVIFLGQKLYFCSWKCALLDIYCILLIEEMFS